MKEKVRVRPYRQRRAAKPKEVCAPCVRSEDEDAYDSLSNVYDHPENWNLKTVGDIDLGEGYEFDLFVVWIDEAGNFYYKTDSGCSCPNPFETVTHPAQLDRASDTDDLRRVLVAWFSEERAERRSIPSSRVDALVNKADRMQKARRK